MSIHFQAGGALRNLSDCKVQVGGAIKQVSEIWIQTGGVLKRVWQNLVSYSVAVSYSNPGNSVSRSNRFVATVGTTPAGSKFEFFLEDETTKELTGPWFAMSTTNPQTMDVGSYDPNEPTIVLQTVRVYVKVYNSSNVLVGFARSTNTYSIVANDGLG